MAIFNSANIMLPKNVDFSKWSVVACDQFTSQRDYWEKAENIVGDAPSTLNMIFPEVYLNDAEPEKRIEKINAEMEKYSRDGIFEEYKDALFYVERTQSDGKVRHGIVGAVDLEQYDFNKGSQSAIRATEGTIIERIPPRRRIRINAPLELPHILMLIDDRSRSIVENVTANAESYKKLYDFELMEHSGHLKGWLIPEADKARVLEGLKALEDKAAFEEKYGVSDKEVLVIAVGDGNHSLATAKTCWDEIKEGISEEERANHPARFALVELMNIHDEAIEFEPIQRVIFNVSPKKLMDAFMEYYPTASFDNNGGQQIRYTYQGTEGAVYVKDAPSNLPVGTLQRFLDEYLKKNGGEIDYIHGDDVVRDLTKAENTIGFMVDRMEKNDLFTTVIKDGALPRKTFSMGEAQDKRFYLECKKIR
ncbi:MAG: DUF1015 domain-containing protein [bacterium]|nr:DUF1015 domain-containing protein [bacterium]